MKRTLIFLFIIIIISNKSICGLYPFEDYFEEIFFEKVYTNNETQILGLQSKIVKKEFKKYVPDTNNDTLINSYGRKYDYYLEGLLSKEILYRLLNNKIEPTVIFFYYYDSSKRIDSVICVNVTTPIPERFLYYKYYYHDSIITKYHYNSEGKIGFIDSCHYDNKGKLILEYFVDYNDWRIYTEKFVLKYDKKDRIMNIKTYSKSTNLSDPNSYYSMYNLNFIYDSTGKLIKRRIDRDWWNVERNYLYYKNNYLKKTIDTSLTTDPWGVTRLLTDNMTYEYEHDIFNRVVKITSIYAGADNGLYAERLIENIDYEYYALPTSNLEENNLSNFSISPNPASDYIEISVGAGSKPALTEDIRIFDILGIEITTPSTSPLPLSMLGEGKMQIDVSHLAPGVYFVRVGDVVKKFVKM